MNKKSKCLAIAVDKDRLLIEDCLNIIIDVFGIKVLDTKTLNLAKIAHQMMTQKGYKILLEDVFFDVENWAEMINGSQCFDLEILKDITVKHFKYDRQLHKLFWLSTVFKQKRNDAFLRNDTKTVDIYQAYYDRVAVLCWSLHKKIAKLHDVVQPQKDLLP